MLRSGDSCNHEVRPDYPDAVIDAIVACGQLPARPRVLELGVGSGQATAQMVEAGWDVVGVEPGPELAAIARARLARFKGPSVSISTFEAIELPDSSFDVVASATAWHWVDPSVGYHKAARVLRQEGTVALWWNAHVPDTRDPRWIPVRRVYELAAPELDVLPRLTPDRPDYDPAAELHASGRFRDVVQHVFAFSVTYTAEGFLSLLDTYASHRHLDADRRRDLYDRLAEAVGNELGGSITKPYEAVLVLGRPA
ncbi:MAG TPA: class I SAM-dependent methyltransferase [Acidimicrobiales bacterium]|nr:class I SAM-dependent methyltransferase [Acidimicrobiales bacterium]